jgi:tetratricopeptide (TPR) repeat protein
MVPLSRRLTWILTLLMVISLAACQAVWDTAAAPYKRERRQAALLLSEPALPSLRALRAIGLNQRPALADLLWLKSIQYFGQGNPYGKYPSLGPIINTISQLDPQWSYPYEFGMIVLPFMDQTETAVTIGERAQTAIPNDGLLSFYLASVYHLNVKDYTKAAHYYAKAAEEPGGPLASKELAGVALSAASGSTTDREAALYFWKTVYENAKDEGERERAATWFAHMQIVYSLEITAEQFKNVRGRYPLNIEELKQQGFISEIPESPINRILILSPETGKIDFSQLRS